MVQHIHINSEDLAHLIEGLQIIPAEQRDAQLQQIIRSLVQQLQEANNSIAE